MVQQHQRLPDWRLLNCTHCCTRTIGNTKHSHASNAHLQAAASSLQVLFCLLPRHLQTLQARLQRPHHLISLRLDRRCLRGACSGTAAGATRRLAVGSSHCCRGARPAASSGRRQQTPHSLPNLLLRPCLVLLLVLLRS